MIALKFLRARKWHLEKAVAMFIKCLQWRATFEVRKVLEMGERVCEEYDLTSGKSYHFGHDIRGRPVLYAFPLPITNHRYVHVKKHIKLDMAKMERMTVLLIEIIRQVLLPPHEHVCVVLDMHDFSMKNMDYDSVRFMGSCLEAYYPECLGAMYLINTPWIFNGSLSISLI
jgi:hypothetical protein